MKLELMVNGMTCGGCELHVENAVKEISRIIDAKADHTTGKLRIKLDKTLSADETDSLIAEVGKKVETAGYKLEGLYDAKKSSENFSIKQWIGIIVILAALFMFVKETGIMNRLPVIEGGMGYGLIFIIGLMTSVHCIGMCGGINLTVSTASILNYGEKDGRFRRIKPALLYNTGRVVSYTAVGAAAGALGSVLSISGNIQGIIVGVAGVLMLFMGVNMLGIFPWVSKILPRLPKGLSSRIINSGNGRGPFIVGLLNGFMPCGPLQSVQIYALGTGSAVAGAFSMFLFSIGTVPLMLGFGSIASVLPKKFHGKILKISALLVLLLGGGMIARGLSLNGVTFAGTTAFGSNNENVRIAEIIDSKQFVTTYMHEDEYEPFIVQAGIPVVWTIQVEEDVLNGCNNPLTVPEYGIRYTMQPGENIIEFTPPTEETTIGYTCWMGMITSGIKVVDDISSVDPSLLSDTAALSGSSEGCSSGCCGSSAGANGPGYPLTLNDFPEIPADQIGYAKIEDGVQYVEVFVDNDGYTPSVVVMERGIETQWTIEAKELNEQNYRMIFPVYGNQGVELVEGTNALRIFPEFDFQYFSWNLDFGGFIKVVDDIETVDELIVKSAVDAYNDSSTFLME